MNVTETLAHEPATKPGWVRWLLIGMLAGTGAVTRLATTDPPSANAPAAHVVAPLPIAPPDQSLFTIVLPPVPTPPTHCFANADAAERMMRDWRAAQVVCVRAYLHSLHRWDTLDRWEEGQVTSPTTRSRATHVVNGAAGGPPSS